MRGKDFKTLMREYRLRHNLTQEALAKLTGISRISLNRYETGKTSPRLNHAITIAEALKISLNDLKNPAKIVHFASILGPAGCQGKTPKPAPSPVSKRIIL